MTKIRKFNEGDITDKELERKILKWNEMEDWFENCLKSKKQEFINLEYMGKEWVKYTSDKKIIDDCYLYEGHIFKTGSSPSGNWYQDYLYYVSTKEEFIKKLEKDKSKIDSAIQRLNQKEKSIEELINEL